MSNAQHDGATSGRDVSQSSPQESSPGGSNTGTPDTLITSFSPETFAQRAEHLDTQMSLFKPKSTNFVATGLTSMDRDPFVTTNFVKSEQKLSPTASSFHPFEMKLQGITAAPVRLDQKSENSSAKTEDSNISATQLGTFSIDTSVTRAIKITGIYGPISFAEVENCLRVSSCVLLEFMCTLNGTKHPHRRQIYSPEDIEFSDTESMVLFASVASSMLSRHTTLPLRNTQSGPSTT